jgi:two-component system, NarL family, captular synthesis response regulator RcsB
VDVRGREGGGGVRIVIADDHEVVRIGLRVVLQRGNEGYEVVGEASSGSELLQVLDHTGCDVAIVDFQMQENAGSDGVVLLRELRRRHPRLRIVVLTVLRNLSIFRTMYQEGVDAVVEKAAVVQELLVALRTVRAGRTYRGEPIHEHLMHRGKAALEGSHDSDRHAPALSAREAEVVRLLARGLTVSEVARSTHRSVKTISLQKRSAMAKLGIVNDQQLFEYAHASGLL